MIIFYFTSPKLLVILKNSSFINSYKFLYKFCRVLSLVFVLFKLKFIKYRRRQIMFAITTEVILTHTPQSIFSDGITHIPRYEFAQGLLLWFLDIRETKKKTPPQVIVALLGSRYGNWWICSLLCFTNYLFNIHKHLKINEYRSPFVRGHEWIIILWLIWDRGKHRDLLLGSVNLWMIWNSNLSNMCYAGNSLPKSLWKCQHVNC